MVYIRAREPKLAEPDMKTGKILHILILFLTGIYLAAHVILHNSQIQEKSARHIAGIISSATETEISAGKMQFTFPFGFQVDNLTVYDLSGDTLAHIGSATFRLKPLNLLERRISITSIGIYNPDIRLKTDSAGQYRNWSFLIKEKVKDDSPLKLALNANSIFIKNGSLEFDAADIPETPGLFNKNHIGIHSLTASISLKELKSDTVSVYIRKAGFREKSGFALTKSRGSIFAGPSGTRAIGLTVKTPESAVNFDRIEIGAGLGSSFSSTSRICTDFSSYVTCADFKAFLPQLATMTEKVRIDVSCDGSLEEMEISDMCIQDSRGTFRIRLHGTARNPMEPERIELSGGRLKASLSDNFCPWLEKQLAGFGLRQLPRQAHTGNTELEMTLDGTVSDLVAKAALKTEQGSVMADVDGKSGKYFTRMNIQRANLGFFTGNHELGNFTGAIQWNTFMNDSTITLDDVRADIASATFRKFTYRNAVLKARSELSRNGRGVETLEGSVAYGDSVGSLNAKASYMADNGSGPSVWADIACEKLWLSDLNLYNKAEKAEISAHAVARLSGTGIDDMVGKVSIDSLSYSDNLGRYFMENLTTTIAEVSGNHRMTSVTSDFMNLSLIGDYRLTTLPSTFMTVFSELMPSLSEMAFDKAGIKPEKGFQPNSFVLSATIGYTDIFRSLFHIPLDISDYSTVNCIADGHSGSLSASIGIPGLAYAGNSVENGKISVDINNGACHSTVNGTARVKGLEPTDLSVMLTAFDDNATSLISISNRKEGLFDGSFLVSSNFVEYRKNEGWLQWNCMIDTTTVTFSNAQWNISPLSLELDSSHVHINHLMVNNSRNQYITADGIVGRDSTEVLNVALKGMDIDKLSQMLGASGLDAHGIINGNISLVSLLETPVFYGNIDIDDFGILNSYHGNVKADCKWNPELSRIEISAKANDPGISSTIVDGWFVPADKYIDTHISANRTDLNFLNKWLDPVFTELSGRASGNIHLLGKVPSLDIIGEAIVEEGYFNLRSTSTAYLVENDTIWFKDNLMDFHSLELTDEYGHPGLLNCQIRHDNLSNFEVDINATANGIQAFYMPRTEDSNIDAKVFADGSVTLTYTPADGIFISADASTAPGTRVNIDLSKSSATNYNFLTIVDRSEIRSGISPAVSGNMTGNKVSRSRLGIDFNIQCNDNTRIEVSGGSLTGSLSGSGLISAKYDWKNPNVILNGQYNVGQGQCMLTLENLIRIDFALLQTSNVRFNGAPLETELDLHAYHNVTGASLSMLDPSYTGHKNTKVRCLLDISGGVQEPSLAFDVDAPDGTADEKSILSTALATEEQRNTQFLYLLATGNFYTFDYADSETMNGGQSTMESILNSTINGQINNLISNVLDSDIFSFSSAFNASSYLPGYETSMTGRELEGMLEARLLDNRLLINGNFGYREDLYSDNTNFIGDFEVEWLLVPQYGISVMGYSKNNDRYFSKTTLTTQGVGLKFEKDFDSIFRRRK